MLDKGADVNRANNQGTTPLDIAKSQGHLSIVALLGGQLGLPLHVAAGTGDVDAMTQLLDGGAAVDLTRVDGEMPLHIACGNGHVDAARLLLDKGAEVDRANQNGTTPLYVACQNGHVDAARLLLDKGADVDQSRNGVTLLFLACQNGHVDVAQLLLERSAEVDRAQENGTTPLFVACQLGHVDAARLLLEKGAEVDRATNWGATPLSIAKLRRHSAVVALLEESRPLPLGKPRLLRQQSDVQCSICLGPCVERAWTKCNHSFCRKCITQVCRTNPSTNRAPCPFCRQPLLLGDLTRRPSVAGCAMS